MGRGRMVVVACLAVLGAEGGARDVCAQGHRFPASASEVTRPHVPRSGAEQEERDEDATIYNAEVAFHSRYVSDGVAQSPGPALQPSLSVSRRGTTLSFWSNINASRRGGADALPRQWNEVNLSLARSFERGRATVEPGAILYLSPNNSFGTTGEITLRLARKLGKGEKTRVYTSHFLDVGKFKGAYFGELGLIREHSFSSRLSGEATLSLGVANSRWNEANVGPRKSALNVAGLHLSLIYDLGGGYYLAPHLGLTHILNRDLRDALEDPTLVNFGVATGRDF